MSDAPRLGQVTKNCHYISGFLTRPWEVGQRQLHYYDFDSDTFGKSSWKSLFAEHEINPPDVERWLNDVIEDPLAKVRPRLAAGDPRALDEWRFFRAAVLMLWLQGVRVQSVANEDGRRDLAALAARPAEQIDALVIAIRETYDLRLVFTVSSSERIAALFMPSSGIFQFTFPDEGCLSRNAVGIGLPLDLTCALVATAVEQHGKIDFSLLPGSISNCSVGTSQARRVVIPPGALDLTPEADLRQDLRDLRRANDGLTTAVRYAQQLVAKMFDAAGCQARRDGSGRVRPPTL